jgi:hypothetical protein
MRACSNVGCVALLCHIRNGRVVPRVSTPMCITQHGAFRFKNHLVVEPSVYPQDVGMAQVRLDLYLSPQLVLNGALHELGLVQYLHRLMLATSRGCRVAQHTTDLQGNDELAFPFPGNVNLAELPLPELSSNLEVI